MLLNPDTVVQEHAVHELVRFMDEHPDVGITGSRLEDPDKTPQRSAFRFHGILSEFERGFRLGLVTRLLRRYTVAPPAHPLIVKSAKVTGAARSTRASSHRSPRAGAPVLR